MGSLVHLFALLTTGELPSRGDGCRRICGHLAARAQNIMSISGDYWTTCLTIEGSTTILVCNVELRMPLRALSPSREDAGQGVSLTGFMWGP